jgi:hypothetical protein
MAIQSLASPDPDFKPRWQTVLFAAGALFVAMVAAAPRAEAWRDRGYITKDSWNEAQSPRGYNGWAWGNRSTRSYGATGWHDHNSWNQERPSRRR